MTTSVSVDAARHRSKIIFGVDDNPANLAILKELLTAAGYQFFGFSNGADCISSSWRIVPKLILLDVNMPDLDGFEICRRLRTQPQTRDVPIAFVTARKTREDVRQGLAAGGNDFIVKPFERGHLLERVEMWTTRRLEMMNRSRSAIL